MLVLGIGFLQNIMELLENVMDCFKKIGFHVSLNLRMGGFFLCG